jgi:hypothetical protein
MTYQALQKWQAIGHEVQQKNGLAGHLNSGGKANSTGELTI